MKTSVVGIVFQKERSEVLLIKRRDVPVWVLPGGGIDPHETPEEACIREVLEESGYRVKIVRKVATYQPVNRLTRLTHFFECCIVGGAPEIGPETREVGFFPLSDLPPLLAPPYDEWIADAAQNLSSPIEKKISGVSYTLLFKHLLQHPILVGRFLLTKIGIHINR